MLRAAAAAAASHVSHAVCVKRCVVLQVSDDSASAAGSGGYDPFSGSSGSHAAGTQAPLVPLKHVEARPG
jgi:hypothetical protein